MANDDSDASSGDFALLYIQHQRTLYGYIASLLPNRSDAEEILQRTSLVMWQKWNQFDAARGFVAWGRGIALNEVRNFVRRSDRKNICLSESVLSLLADEAERQSVDDRVDALQNCLDGLADHQVELLETCYLCSDGVQIVARSRGIEPSAVYMRLHRLRKALMECIERRMALELNEQPSVSE